jgi:hypothetical protein
LRRTQKVDAGEAPPRKKPDDGDGGWLRPKEVGMFKHVDPVYGAQHQAKFAADMSAGRLEHEEGLLVRDAVEKAGLLEQLEKRCSGRGGKCGNGMDHAQCSAKVAQDAQVYSKQLCEAMLRGMQAQLKELGMLQSGVLGIQAAAAEWEADELLSMDRPRPGFSGRHRDDGTGQILNDALVAEARHKELEYFAIRGVWVKRHREEAFAKQGTAPSKWCGREEG